MTHKQSRRTQRALEKDLFGPEPTPLRRVRQREVAAYLDPSCSPGECSYCGNCSSMAPGQVFYCSFCGSMYPADGEAL